MDAPTAGRPSTPAEAEMMTAGEIAHALGGRRIGQDSYVVRCPAHEDRSPSLSLAGDGLTLWHCYAGCSQRDVRDASTCRRWSPHSGLFAIMTRPGRRRRSTASGSTRTAASSSRLMLGPVGGCAVKLDADDMVEQGLGVCEGIETGLAIRATGWRPVLGAGLGRCNRRSSRRYQASRR